MNAYIIRRLLLMIPTLLGILFVSFIIVQFAPGGPVERVIAQLTGADTGAASRISGSSGGDLGARLPGNNAGGGGSPRNIAVPRGSIRISSSRSRSSSASTSRLTSAFC